MIEYIFSTDRSTQAGFYIPGCGPGHEGGEGGCCKVVLTMHGRRFGAAIVKVYDSLQTKRVIFEKELPAEAGVEYELEFDVTGAPNAVLIISGGLADKLLIVNH